MKSQNNKKLQESIQKALLGKLNESFWDSDEFPYDLSEHPEYTPEAIGAKKYFRQLLNKKGFKTKYWDEDKYQFDEPWLDVEKYGISDSFDIIEDDSGFLYLMSGVTADSDSESNLLTGIGYRNQDKMNLDYDEENNPEGLDRIGIMFDKDNYESTIRDIVNDLEHDYKVASEIKNEKGGGSKVSDASIEKEIKKYMDANDGKLPMDDRIYDIAEIFDSNCSEDLVNQIYNILYTKFGMKDESKRVTESKNNLKLSDSDIAYLKKIGHTDEDIPQIEEALNVTKYTLGNADVSDNGNIEIPDEEDDVEITAQEAREILGDDKFLSGLSRSAFHWTSGRWSDDDTKYVSFDSSKLFEENKELKTEDAISLEFTDYIVEGEAVLNLWGGGQGRIVMDSYHIDEVTPEEICSNANDGQFGCESIEGIEGTIYKNYSGHAVYYKDFEYMGEDFIKYSGANAKRGIKAEDKEVKTESKKSYECPQCGLDFPETDLIKVDAQDVDVASGESLDFEYCECPECEYRITRQEWEENKLDENKSVKEEAYNYNWRDDIEEVEDTEENDELVYAFAENLIETDPDYADYDDPWQIISNIISVWKIPKKSRLYDYLLKWYGSESNMKNNIRSFYETNDAIYFETGCGYSIFDADLLGGNADGTTADEFSRFVANGGKKEEGLDDKSGVAERSRKLKLMDIACRSINDEDIIDIWLYDGCPDESTQEDYDEIAEDIDEYNRMETLFKGLMKHAVADGLYDCPEEAYEFAKQYQPDLKNIK